MKLEKPLVIFDLETTGIDTEKDRIVQFAARKLTADGLEIGVEILINPGVPIPQGATDVHGITDEDVKDSPKFHGATHGEIDNFIGDSDLGGFNVMGFDIPMLQAEYQRAGTTFDMTGRRVIDAMEIFHRMEPRNLAGALKLYCGREHTEAHDAMGDVEATIDVLEAQLAHYEDVLPRDVDELSKWCLGDRVTLDGKLIWVDDEVAIGFGKHKGSTLYYLSDNEHGYLRWMLRQSFSNETLDIVLGALNGRFPSR